MKATLNQKKDAASPVGALKSRGIVAVWVDIDRREIVCGFEGGHVVRKRLRDLGIAESPRVVAACPDEEGGGVILVRQNGHVEDCAADLILGGGSEAELATHFSRSLAGRVAKRVRKLRRERGLTQRELARDLEMAPSNYARLEMGKHSPTPSTLVRLSRALRVPLSALVAR